MLFGFLAFTNNTSAQIIQFSQYYSSPAILGPSFAGINGGTRLILNYRNQWPGVPANFVTYAFAFDHYLEKRNSGIGLTVLRDQAGSGNLSVTDVGLQYSYDLKVWGRRPNEVHFRPGVSFKYSQRGLDFYRLVFNDQLDFDGTAETTIENPPEVRGYPDASTSMMLYSNKWWFGATGDHLFQPDQSFQNYGGSESRLPLLISVYGGYRLDLKSKGRGRRGRIPESLTFSFLYKMQGGFSQMDLGMYWTKYPFILGGWYRGVPFLNNPEENYYTTDAVVVLLGYKIADLTIGYSYDITVSSLMPNTNGTHEISIKYDFSMQGQRLPRRRRGAVSCPVL